MGRTFRLDRPELGAEVERLLQLGGSRRQMERLMALRMGLGGEHTLAQIAAAVGRARSSVIIWMRVARQEGVASLLGKHQGRGRAAQLEGATLKELRHGLRRGRWKRAKEAQVWLQQRHGLSLSLSGVRYWLKKAGES
jgi:transposase